MSIGQQALNVLLIVTAIYLQVTFAAQELEQQCLISNLLCRIRKSKTEENLWERIWKRGAISQWDLGMPTPALVHLNNSGTLPKGRALIPGCGTGYDVAAISSPERFVVGLDISVTCITRAKKYHSSSSNAENFEFVKADFFKYQSTQLFDLIFDYTFFCAIKPRKRSKWANQISKLLKPDGELITLMLFPTNVRSDVPPYKVSVSSYANVLNPLGFKAVEITDNELAVGDRKGKEKLARWKRS